MKLNNNSRRKTGQEIYKN